MPSAGCMMWSSLTQAVLQWCLVWWLSLMLLYQYSQGMTCLLFVPRRSDCHGIAFPTCMQQIDRSDETSVFFLVSSTCFSGLDRSFSGKRFWGYHHRQTLLRWPTPTHCQQTGHSILLYLVLVDHDPMGGLTLYTIGHCLPAASTPCCFNFGQLHFELLQCGFYQSSPFVSCCRPSNSAWADQITIIAALISSWLEFMGALHLLMADLHLLLAITYCGLCFLD
jgi:hypothetical protein